MLDRWIQEDLTKFTKKKKKLANLVATCKKNVACIIYASIQPNIKHTPTAEFIENAIAKCLPDDRLI